MRARRFIFLRFSLVVTFSFAFMNCLFEPEYGPISSGIYVANGSTAFACGDARDSLKPCESLATRSYWDIGTKWIKFRTYADNKLVCRGGARLGEVRGDTLMALDYRDSCMTREAGRFNNKKWTGFKRDTVQMILEQKTSEGFRARILTDSAWMEFRRMR